MSSASSGTGRRRALWIAAAVVAVLVVVAAVIAINNAANSKPTVTAIFNNASPLVEGNQVRASGAEVGLVDSITVEGGKAKVVLELDPAVVPLHRDATLRVRPVNLLGERYIELNPGSPSAPLMGDADVIPETQTGATVDVQDIVDSLANPTANSLATVVTSLGEGLDGQGGKAADTLKALQPALNDTGKLAGLLNDQNGVLISLLDRVRPVAGELGDADGKTLDQLVGNTRNTLAATTAERQALDQTLAQLPDTVTTARQTLRELTGAAKAGTPTLESIRPVTKDLKQISGEIEQLSEAADPALGSLPPVLDRADKLLDQLRPVVSDLRKTGPDLKADAKLLRPLGSELLNDNLGDLMDFARKWAISTNGNDGYSHYFRGVLFFTPATLQEFLTNSPSIPGLNGAAKLPPLPNLTKAGLGGAAPKLPTDPRNATGLTPGQEESMVGQLLGGR